jgi:ketopantoate reductase
MDIQHSQPPNLATRLRLAKLDDRVATLLATAVREELGLDLLDGRDAEAAARLGELIEMAARHSGPCAVNKFALLADAPAARDLLSRPRPEMAPA